MEHTDRPERTGDILALGMGVWRSIEKKGLGNSRFKLKMSPLLTATNRKGNIAYNKKLKKKSLLGC